MAPQRVAEKKRETPIDPEVLCEKALGWTKVPGRLLRGFYEWVLPDGKRFNTTPDFENVFADAWLLVEALSNDHLFVLMRQNQANRTAFWWSADIKSAGTTRPFEGEGEIAAQAITRARWAMLQEEDDDLVQMLEKIDSKGKGE